MQWQKSVLCCSVAMVGLPLLPVSDAFAARVALVIGNAAYKDVPLRNPVNDARAMAASLKRGLNDALRQVVDLRPKELLQRRDERLRSYGRFNDTKEP